MNSDFCCWGFSDLIRGIYNSKSSFLLHRLLPICFSTDKYPEKCCRQYTAWQVFRYITAIVQVYENHMTQSPKVCDSLLQHYLKLLAFCKNVTTSFLISVIAALKWHLPSAKWNLCVAWCFLWNFFCTALVLGSLITSGFFFFIIPHSANVSASTAQFSASIDEVEGSAHLSRNSCNWILLNRAINLLEKFIRL